jgi:2-keto-4-pentenoate hydratase/2-oxohepta-3-ene-1,7-dioic acid hydratase in catechol pathway
LPDDPGDLADLVANDPGSLLAHVAELAAHPLLGPLRPTGVRHPLGKVRFLAPVIPSKVVAIGRNYADHAREMASEPPAEPMMFLKPSTSVIGDHDPIAYPRQSSEVHHEGELAVVIGRPARDVPAEHAASVIFGYTIANDVTARDLQRRDGQWSRAKGFDTFCPLGPWVETALDPADLRLVTRVNGEVRQDGRTSDLLFDVPALIAHVSAAMTLLPGDVLLTGTPAGVGPLQIGDEVSVQIEGIGTLTNTVVRR